jgi:hypothetical protein
LARHERLVVEAIHIPELHVPATLILLGVGGATAGASIARWRRRPIGRDG